MKMEHSHENESMTKLSNCLDNSSSIGPLEMSLDQSSDVIKIPNDIDKLVFGPSFNQNIDNVEFHDRIRIIQFGNGFNKNIDNVKFPKNLETIIFGKKFTYSLACLKRIPTLKQIYLHHSTCDSDFIVHNGDRDAKLEVADGCVLERHNYEWDR